MNTEQPPKLLFISGDRSSVGKSTVCMGLLGSLLRSGRYLPSDLAYIKPATQCRDVQLVSKFCEANGIAHQGMGPLVFYSGFTRECINGQGPNPQELLDKIEEAVHNIAAGKKLVLVDGVGYPSVGSVVGVSNAHIAQRLGAPVLLVGKHGCGDAIDSFNLNQAFFEKYQVKVIGGIFNKILVSEYEDIKTHVGRYFETNQPNVHIYGFIPVAAPLLGKDEDTQVKGACQRVTPATLAMSEEEREQCGKAIDNFIEHVDLERLSQDLLVSSSS